MGNEREDEKDLLGSGIEYCSACLNGVREVIGHYYGTRLEGVRVAMGLYSGNLARG